MNRAMPGRRARRSPSEAARAAAAGHISTTVPGGALRKPGGTSSARAGLSGPSTRTSRSAVPGVRVERDEAFGPERCGRARTGESAARRETRWRPAAADRPAARRCRRRSAAGYRARRRQGGAAARAAAPGWSRPGEAARRGGIRGAARAARSRSAISVPRPGPSSARITGSGRPMRCQKSTTQAPISSPKIWLISGAVMKSPAAPNGSRRRVITGIGIVQRDRHVGRDRQRPLAPDAPGDPGGEAAEPGDHRLRRSCRPLPAARAPRRSARCRRAVAGSTGAVPSSCRRSGSRAAHPAARNSSPDMRATA